MRLDGRPELSEISVTDWISSAQSQDAGFMDAHSLIFIVGQDLL
jgi:hypothetical protein